MFEAVHAYTAWVKRLFFPNMCFGCDRIGAFLCAPCERALARAQVRTTCLWCDQIVPHGVCRRHRKRFALACVLASAPYAHGTARKLIESHKYDGIGSAANIMARSMIFLLRDLPFSPTRIILIPSTKRRERSRGGPHLLALAGPIAKELGIPIDTTSLVRIRDTPTLVRTHSSRERMHILKNALKATHPLNGERILLLDDVVTSGSTLREASRALKRAGAEDIAAMVFARA